MDVFTRLDLQKTALLLDVDGTIIDIGPSPKEVEVAAGLRETLRRLFDFGGGALALVSGRPIVDLDRLFTPLRLPTVGGHGAEMRLRDGEVLFWASRCQGNCACGLQKARASGLTSWWRTRITLSHCIIEDPPNLQNSCAAMLPPAPRNFRGSPPNCC